MKQTSQFGMTSTNREFPGSQSRGHVAVRCLPNDPQGCQDYRFGSNRAVRQALRVRGEINLPRKIRTQLSCAINRLKVQRAPVASLNIFP